MSEIEEIDARLALGIRHYGETQNVLVDFESEIEELLIAVLDRRKKDVLRAFGAAKRDLNLAVRRTGRGRKRFRVEKSIAAVARTKKAKLALGLRWSRTGAAGEGPWIAAAFVKVKHPALRGRAADLWLSMNAATAAYDDKGRWFSAFIIDPEAFSIDGTLDALDMRLSELLDLVGRMRKKNI